MQRKTTAAKAALLAVLLLAALPLAGCSIGYVSMHPGENSALYNDMFSDIIHTYDEPRWLWIRGTISGDLNGNGIVDEEVILATIQQGTQRNPGPIEMAFLVACEILPDGSRQSLSRVLLFEGDPVADAYKPYNDLGLVSSKPLTRARAQMVQDKNTLKETVVAYFWGDDMPGSVWYAGYSLEEDGFKQNLEAAIWQPAPGFLSINLDKSVAAAPFGYQLVFGVAAVPDAVVRKLGPVSEAPLWGHVFARDEHGVYRQADERFGEHYRKIENSWNQLYLKAMLQELPAGELAWFEYHMGILNHYTGNRDMAIRFLEKARKGAEDQILVDAVARGIEFVSRSERQPDPNAGTR